jgi:AraC-like DNA-binding protein
MENQLMSGTTNSGFAELKLKGFKVYEIDSSFKMQPSCSRWDFFKISINTGHAVIHYGDQLIDVDGTFLFFGNPHLRCTIDVFEPTQNSYACIFTEEFLKIGERSDNLHESPLFKIGSPNVFKLNDLQSHFMKLLFDKIYLEQDSEYAHKDDLIRNYISLIIHEALKIQPSPNVVKHHNAASRITSMFMELLERQFPIESKEQPLRLRTPKDYAQGLSLHINHLNRAVREATGKPITSHITERIISEAKALLQYTDWSIAEVAYSLGFEYPSYFNNYFKRLTGTVPKSIRDQVTR